MLLFPIEDSNFTMFIRIVNEKEKQIILNSFFYKVYINFAYKKTSVIDIARVPNEILNNLLEKYGNLVHSGLLVKSLSNSKSENKKSTINKIKEIFNYRETSPAFFRAIDIISIDGFSSKPIGRTIIELDADIINMLPAVTSEKLLHFRVLHNYNVALVNQTFSYQSKVFQKRLLLIRRIARIFSPLIPLISHYGYNILPGKEVSLLELSKYPELFNWIPLIVGSILGYFYYRYAPKYITRTIIKYVSGEAFK